MPLLALFYHYFNTAVSDGMLELWSQNCSSFLPSYMSLAKSLNLSGTQFSHL